MTYLHIFRRICRKFSTIHQYALKFLARTSKNLTAQFTHAEILNKLSYYFDRSGAAWKGCDKMRIKQIASNHIEVTVTDGDLLSFDTDIESLTPDSPYLKNFLFKVMERVKNETGFDPKNGHILIEAQRSLDRIVFNIKRMGLTREEKKKKYKGARPVIKRGKEKVYIYGFENFSDMTDALSKLDADVLLSASIYGFEEVYYCFFRTSEKNMYFDSVMREFCDAKDDFEFTESILCEHGKHIAVGSEVVTLIDGIKKYGL